MASLIVKPPTPVSMPADHIVRFALSSGVLEEYGTSPDGDCLFSSVAAIIRTASPAYAQRIDECMRRNKANFKCANVTATALRTYVAACALDETNELMSNALSMWIEIARSAQAENDHALMVEYNHVLPVIKCSDSAALTPSERLTVFKQMRKRTYWGEQVALQIMRRLTGVVLLVFDAQGRLMFQFGADQEAAQGQGQSQGQGQGPAEARPAHVQLYGLLHLSGRHFQPLGYKGQLCFAESTLPFVVASMLTVGESNELVSETLRAHVLEAQALLADARTLQRVKNALLNDPSPLPA